MKALQMNESKNNVIGKRGAISAPLMGIVLVVVILIMIAVPIAFLHIHLNRAVKIEYKRSNADMALLGLLSYPDVRQDMSFYVSGLDTNEHSNDEFDKEAFETKVESLLDTMVGECYKLTYQVSSSSTSPIIDKTENEANVESCEPGYLAKTFVVMPYGQAPVKLILEIA